MRHGRAHAARASRVSRCFIRGFAYVRACTTFLVRSDSDPARRTVFNLERRRPSLTNTLHFSARFSRVTSIARLRNCQVRGTDNPGRLHRRGSLQTHDRIFSTHNNMYSYAERDRNRTHVTISLSISNDTSKIEWYNKRYIYLFILEL